MWQHMQNSFKMILCKTAQTSEFNHYFDLLSKVIIIKGLKPPISVSVRQKAQNDTHNIIAEPKNEEALNFHHII